MDIFMNHTDFMKNVYMNSFNEMYSLKDPFIQYFASANLLSFHYFLGCKTKR